MGDTPWSSAAAPARNRLQIRLISVHETAMLDMIPACLQGEGPDALRVPTQGPTLISLFPAYAEIGNEQSILSTEEKRDLLHLGRVQRQERL